MNAPAPLERFALARDPLDVAPWLLGKVLSYGGCSGRIVEVEAYRGADDAASHAFGGQSTRNQTMFGRAGLLYVYFTYGMHYCANVVCGEEGTAWAVLVRALEPLAGIDEMRRRRPAAHHDRDLCNGPAKLCEALGITRELDGADLLTADRGIVLEDDGTSPPSEPHCGPRVGITKAVEHPWRWSWPGSTFVSRARPAGRSSPN